MRLSTCSRQTFGGWGADGVCLKAFQKSESADDQISVIRRSAVLVIAVASFRAQLPANCQRCAVQAGSTPSSRCRTWRSCKKSSATMAQLAMTNCRETGGFGRSHSLSFDHRLRPDTLRTAMATAFFCPTSTTSFLPRVTPV